MIGLGRSGQTKRGGREKIGEEGRKRSRGQGRGGLKKEKKAKEKRYENKGNATERERSKTAKRQASTMESPFMMNDLLYNVPNYHCCTSSGSSSQVPHRSISADLS